MDIFDIAMANALNKGGTNGGDSAVKVIDLSKHIEYDITVTSTFNDVIIGLLAKGGGSVTVAEYEPESIWKDIVVGSPLMFKFDLGVLGVDLGAMYSGAIATFETADGEPAFAFMSFCVFYDGYTRVSVLFENAGGAFGVNGESLLETTITVAAERLSIPS